jgi:hypothetical protein
MSQWLFVGAAYALVVIGTLVLIVASWAAMRRAENAADALRRP